MAIITQVTGQFSGYVLSELRALVLRMLRVTDTIRYSPTGGTADYDWIDDALNRGQEDFVRQTHCLRTYAVIELKANYRTYRLPWNFLDFMTVYFYDSSLTDGYRELKMTTVEMLNDEISNWRTKVGDPEQVYVDRIYGTSWMFGIYPIPNVDGELITFSSEYGAVVQWVCPIYTYNQEYGVIIRMTDTDEFFLNTDSGVVGKVYAMSGNLWMEYYRLPEKMTHVSQYPEIPREYQKSLSYFAVSDLLQNNPEDSAEFKRSMSYMKQFAGEIDSYIKRRKKPLSGQTLRAIPSVWNWVANMPFRAQMP
jgi:hypothetical protein